MFVCELATSRLVLTTPGLGFRLDAMIRSPCSRLRSSEIGATNSISLLSFEWGALGSTTVFAFWYLSLPLTAIWSAWLCHTQLGVPNSNRPCLPASCSFGFLFSRLTVLVFVSFGLMLGLPLAFVSLGLQLWLSFVSSRRL